jgi:hypothetical protein
MIDDPISYFPLANMHYDEFDKNLIEYLGFFFVFSSIGLLLYFCG